MLSGGGLPPERRNEGESRNTEKPDRLRNEVKQAGTPKIFFELSDFCFYIIKVGKNRRSYGKNQPETFW